MPKPQGSGIFATATQRMGTLARNRWGRNPSRRCAAEIHTDRTRDRHDCFSMFTEMWRSWSLMCEIPTRVNARTDPIRCRVLRRDDGIRAPPRGDAEPRILWVGYVRGRCVAAKPANRRGRERGGGRLVVAWEMNDAPRSRTSSVRGAIGLGSDGVVAEGDAGVVCASGLGRGAVKRGCWASVSCAAWFAWAELRSRRLRRPLERSFEH
jgi:hypothetical protein